MSSSISDSRKERGRGRPSTGIGSAIGLRLYPNLQKRLDEWIRAQDPKPSRPEAIRRLLDMALTAQTPSQPDKLATAVKASEMASLAIDRLGDKSAPPQEQAKRKRRLVKGPSEFREMRDDLPKPQRRLSPAVK
jgi:hypothetical protein